MKNLWIVSLLFCIACASSSNKSSGSKSGDKNIGQFITKSQMSQRSKLVKNVHYDMEFDLTDKSQKFSAKVTSVFDMKKKENLRVDFFQGDIKVLLVNNKIIQTPNYNKYFITIPKEYLKKGVNTISISYNQNFSKNGAGFYRFKDPKDNRIYLYTDFQPYDANHMFPCFDQPNLKATYKINVKAPKDWKVITYDYATKIQKKGDIRIWNFPRSDKFSTYIFSLHAGPYKEWSDKYKSKSRTIPLKLYVRKSLAQYIKPRFWFEVTKGGMKYFDELFAMGYPYKKYDQIIVPDFNAGAMENVAAVTFSERYVKKSPKRFDEKERNANVILHELAHMWFGNLVTMDWWNGLWLNESFATVMANMALSESDTFKKTWQTFFNSSKSWAYWTDNLVTTHPIEVPVNDTDTAFTNFDGITYGKGASVLKQLRFLLGEDFKKGIQIYFKEHAGGTTHLSDFFSAMEKASGKDLGPWVKNWILKPSFNTIEVAFTCEQDKIKTFSILQNAKKNFTTLREHKTQLALFNLKNKNMSLSYLTSVIYNGKSTNIDKVIGKKCPDFVYPNYNDEDYVKVKLDNKSLNFAKNSIISIEDEFLSSMVWSSLWDMVEQSKLSYSDYVTMVLDFLPKSKSDLLTNVLTRNVYRYGSRYAAYSRPEVKKELTKKLEEFAWTQLRGAKAGSDSQKKWYNNFVIASNTEFGKSKLIGILNRKIKFKGMRVDQDKRWLAVRALNKLGAKRGLQLIQAELKKDNSERSQKSALASEVIRPGIKNKKQWLNDLLNPNTKRSLSHQKIIMRNLFPANQVDLKSKVLTNWEADLKTVLKSKDNIFLTRFTRYLTPSMCDEKSIKYLANFIKENQDLPVVILKNLKINNQENEKCYRIVKNL